MWKWLNFEKLSKDEQIRNILNPFDNIENTSVLNIKDYSLYFSFKIPSSISLNVYDQFFSSLFHLSSSSTFFPSGKNSFTPKSLKKKVGKSSVLSHEEKSVALPSVTIPGICMPVPINTSQDSSFYFNTPLFYSPPVLPNLFNSSELVSLNSEDMKESLSQSSSSPISVSLPSIPFPFFNMQFLLHSSLNSNAEYSSNANIGRMKNEKTMKKSPHSSSSSDYVRLLIIINGGEIIEVKFFFFFVLFILIYINMNLKEILILIG
jgi:hypothetical protein